MNLSIFNKSASEIILGSIVALSVFAFVAASDAQAKTTEVPSQAHGQEQASLNTANAKDKNSILASRIELDLRQAKVELDKLDEQFRKGEVSAEDLFKATVQFYDMQNMLSALSPSDETLLALNSK